jgi:PAS domain S-box-containing protein
MIRVLHVDDDRALLELAQNFLEQSGDLIVDTAISGKVAHRMLGWQHYDAIVSDYAMPGCNGIELLRHVRRTDERTPFLFFSDQRDEELVVDALMSGADFFLPKGVQVRSHFLQLAHALRESVMRRRAEREHERISSVLRITEAAVRSSLCPITVCDMEGRIVHANPASLAIWGYMDENEVIGRNAADFFASPDFPPDAIPLLLQQKTWSGQATARRKDGSRFEARVFVSTMTDNGGNPLGFVASFTDLTRQRDARGRLESYIRDIRFVSEKAHELTDLPLEGDVFGFIADTIAALAPPGAVIVLSSVHADRTVRTDAVRGPSASLAAIEQLIGRPVPGMTFHVETAGLSSVLPRSFIEIEGGITTITFGKLPPELCHELENLPFIGKIIGTGLSWEGTVHGVTVIILPPGAIPDTIDLLDLFICHCSAVLQRRQAERMLKGALSIPPE